MPADEWPDAMLVHASAFADGIHSLSGSLSPTPGRSGESLKRRKNDVQCGNKVP